MRLFSTIILAMTVTACFLYAGANEELIADWTHFRHSLYPDVLKIISNTAGYADLPDHFMTNSLIMGRISNFRISNRTRILRFQEDLLRSFKGNPPDLRGYQSQGEMRNITELIGPYSSYLDALAINPIETAGNYLSLFRAHTWDVSKITSLTLAEYLASPLIITRHDSFYGWTIWITAPDAAVVCIYNCETGRLVPTGFLTASVNNR